jgi:hypothetical protein
LSFFIFLRFLPTSSSYTRFGIKLAIILGFAKISK